MYKINTPKKHDFFVIDTTLLNSDDRKYRKNLDSDEPEKEGGATYPDFVKSDAATMAWQQTVLNSTSLENENLDFGPFDFREFFSATDLLMKFSDKEMTINEAISSQKDFLEMIKQFSKVTKNKAAVANVRQRYHATQKALQDVVKGVYDMPEVDLKYDPMKDLTSKV